MPSETVLTPEHYLDVSTRHITPRDNELLEQDAKRDCAPYLMPVLSAQHRRVVLYALNYLLRDPGEWHTPDFPKEMFTDAQLAIQRIPESPQPMQPPHDNGLIVNGYPGGYWVFCGEFTDEHDECVQQATAGGYSAALIAILVAAAAAGCSWVKIDRDGSEYEPERFPVFAW